MKKECIIYDANEPYGKRLVNALAKKGEELFETVLFTDKEQLQKYLHDNSPELLLVNENEYFPKVREDYNGTILMLTEDRDVERLQQEYGEKIKGIYRYQGLDRIYAQIVEKGNLGRKIASNVEIIGIYTPVSIDTRVEFALDLSKVLGERERVLFISLEEFSGLSEILPNVDEFTLSDAMYFYRKGIKEGITPSGEIVDKIRSCIGNVDNFDYIFPVKCAEDISFFSSEQIVDFLNLLGKINGYSRVIVDISTAIKQPWKLLGECKYVYMPEGRGYLSKMKLDEFANYFINSGQEKLLESIKKIVLPDEKTSLSKDFWSIVLQTNMYRFVKGMIIDAKG